MLHMGYSSASMIALVYEFTLLYKKIWFHPVTYGGRHDCFRFWKHPSSYILVFVVYLCQPIDILVIHVCKHFRPRVKCSRVTHWLWSDRSPASYCRSIILHTVIIVTQKYVCLIRKYDLHYLYVSVSHALSVWPALLHYLLVDWLVNLTVFCNTNWVISQWSAH